MNWLTRRSRAGQEHQARDVNSLANKDWVKQLVTVARAEKDPEMVRYIVGRLVNMKSPEATDYLMEIVKK